MINTYLEGKTLISYEKNILRAVYAYAIQEMWDFDDNDDAFKLYNNLLDESMETEDIEITNFYNQYLPELTFSFKLKQLQYSKGNNDKNPQKLFVNDNELMNTLRNEDREEWATRVLDDAGISVYLIKSTTVRRNKTINLKGLLYKDIDGNSNYYVQEQK